MKFIKIACCASALVAFAPAAFAQGADAATAQALFEEGRTLLQAGKAAQACPKLAESQRLDPGTGTLLALALCHEKDGKLASAWAEFTEVQGRAQRDRRQDRVKVAKEHAADLRPRLSTLLIEVPPGVATVAGLDIARNGVALGRGAWNVAVPVDGGTYAIKATAPGKVAWEGSIVVKPESDQVRIAVPPLAEPPKETAAAPRRTASEVGVASTSTHDRATSGKRVESGQPWGAMEWGGVAMVGAGAIALGTGGYFLASALGHKKNAELSCTGNYCDDAGLAEQRTAVSRGNVATVFGIVGGTLAAAGVVTFVIGRSVAHKSEPGVSVSFGPLPGGVSGVLSGTF